MLYLGIQQEEWNLLLSQMEEAFSDLDLGTHLLAVYPSGNRLYGLEAESPSLLCLYCDEPATLLDPTNPRLSGKKRTLSLNRHSSTATYISLFSWCTGLVNIEKKILDLEDYFSRIYILPTDIEPIFEDPAITEIMYTARTFLQDHNWGLRHIRGQDCNKAMIPNPFIEALTIRSDAILLETKHFTPSITGNWGQQKVSLRSLDLPIGEETLRQDDLLLTEGISSITDKDSIYHYQLDIAFAIARKYTPETLNKTTTSEVGQAVKKLYLSLL